MLARWGPGAKIVYYELGPSRSGSVAKRLLADFTGHLQVDGYAGYDPVCAENPGIIRVGCMAHVRRYFTEFLKTLPKEARAKHPHFKFISS